MDYDIVKVIDKLKHPQGIEEENLLFSFYSEYENNSYDNEDICIWLGDYYTFDKTIDVFDQTQKSRIFDEVIDELCKHEEVGTYDVTIGNEKITLSVKYITEHSSISLLIKKLKREPLSLFDLIKQKYKAFILRESYSTSKKLPFDIIDKLY